MSAKQLDVRGLGKAYAGQPIVTDISFAVGAGEVVSIVGPSGSGKSTILGMLTGAIVPDTGEVYYDGEPLPPGIAGAGRPFAAMPQRDALMPWRRILDNAAIGLEVRGMRRSEARRRAAELFPQFGLTGTEGLYPAQLSGGMRQRVSFLRTVVQERPVLLLDEPFGALDAITRDELQTWLIGMWEQHRWSVLLVTHDLREAVRLSDRVLVLSDAPGRLCGEVAVSREIPRDHRFHGDARGSALEARVHALLLGEAV